MSRKPYPSDLTDAQWEELSPLLPPDRLQLNWADAGYAGRLVTWAWATGGWLLTVVKRKPDSHRFEVPPRRWVVERTLAWLSRCRRLSKDYEERTESSEAWVHIAMVNLMLKRLQPV